MKLWFDKQSKDPTYFIQVGIRNGKKVTSKNIAKIGKHSELLKVTDAPLAYAKEEVAKYNEEAKKTKVEMEINLDFTQKNRASNQSVSEST